MGITAYKSDGMLNVSWTNLLGRQLLIVNSITGKYVVIRQKIIQDNNAFSENISNFRHTYHLVNGTYYFLATKLGKSPIQSSLVVIDEPPEITISLLQGNILTVNISTTEAIPSNVGLYLVNQNNSSNAEVSNNSTQGFASEFTIKLSDLKSLVSGNYFLQFFSGITKLYSPSNVFYYAESGVWTLSDVLQAGNIASTDIDLTNHDILNAKINDSNTIYTQNMWFPAGFLMSSTTSNSFNGWLLCNGDQFNVNEYPELATILTDGNLPKLNGLFLRGAGMNDGVDEHGSLINTVETTLMASSKFTTEEHNHTITDPGHRHLTTDNLNQDTYYNYLGTAYHDFSGGGNSDSYEFGSTFHSTRETGCLFTSPEYSNVTINEAHTGHDETAPKNYGVNWLISTGKRVPQN